MMKSLASFVSLSKIGYRNLQFSFEYLLHLARQSWYRDVALIIQFNKLSSDLHSTTPLGCFASCSINQRNFGGKSILLPLMFSLHFSKIPGR